MPKCVLYTASLTGLLLKPGPDPEPGPWKTWTLKNLDYENLDYEKRGKQLDAKKRKIRRLHGIIY